MKVPGQTVVEVLIATAVVAMVMTAVVAGLSLSVRNSAQSRYRAIASKMAQEGLEAYRLQRDRMGYRSFATGVATSGSGRYCLNNLPTTEEDFSTLTAGACSTGTEVAGTLIKREAVVEVGAGTPPGSIAVTIEVSWTDSSVTRISQVKQIFKDIN